MKILDQDINQLKGEEILEEGLLNDFQEVFNGLGCFPGEYHIEVDKDVSPVVHAPRRIPITLKDKLKKTLDDLCAAEVIAPVSNPTDWVSSIVLVEKGEKLRICLDPKDLNKAIKRCHYPMPTIDDILPELANAKIFSVLDVKHGFW